MGLCNPGSLVCSAVCARAQAADVPPPGSSILESHWKEQARARDSSRDARDSSRAGFSLARDDDEHRDARGCRMSALMLPALGASAARRRGRKRHRRWPLRPIGASCGCAGGCAGPGRASAVPDRRAQRAETPRRLQAGARGSRHARPKEPRARGGWMSRAPLRPPPRSARFLRATLACATEAHCDGHESTGGRAALRPRASTEPRPSTPSTKPWCDRSSLAGLTAQRGLAFTRLR